MQNHVGKKMNATDTRIFGTLSDGRAVRLWTLGGPEGPGGLRLEVLAYGARIHRLFVPDALGEPEDVVLGRMDVAGYAGADYQGAFIGRCANRLSNAALPLPGGVVQLDRNVGRHNLNGGEQGFHTRLFDVVAFEEGPEEPSLTLAYVSADSESKFPGTLRATVTYRLKLPGTLEVVYTALCDEPCVFNPTNHSLFDLSGSGGDKDIRATELTIAASRLTVCDDDLLPTGDLAEVDAGTGAFDFREAKAIGRDLAADEHMLAVCGGYDQNYCIDGEGFRFHARATDDGSGRMMEVWSDMPGLQLDTCNRGDTTRVGKRGVHYGPHAAFCLEPQFWPDAPNHPDFPQCTLTAGREWTSRTEYRFGSR
ncbi:MAG: galactose mutarotase [Actinomycetes bacterium]|jgi:aldose 1-epimerase|nr:galactose mutarotase [Actinomycetes bacterium]